MSATRVQVVATNDAKLPTADALYALASLSLDPAAAEQIATLDIPRTAVQLLRSNPASFAIAAGRLLGNMPRSPTGLEAMLSYGIFTMAELAFIPGTGQLQQQATFVLERTAAAIVTAPEGKAVPQSNNVLRSAMALAQLASSNDTAARWVRSIPLFENFLLLWTNSISSNTVQQHSPHF
jgi:hypothetical protein